MKNIDKIKTYFKNEFIGEFSFDEPLNNHTWYKIGGAAAVLCSPESEDSLISLLKKCREYEVGFFILGDGANVLVSDSGYDGVVITLKNSMDKCFVHDLTLFAEAGAYLNDVILLAQDNGLAGLESLSGIPGTLGGALYMNAGIDSGNIGDVVDKVMILNENFEMVTLEAKDIDFGYRNVPQLNDKIILATMLKMKPSSSEELSKFRGELLQKRAEKQPLGCPSCGSVFKRPNGFFVGKMVQDLGLKGFRVGDAEISEKHAGFIINKGNATAADVMAVINKIKKEVLKNYKVELETEVKFLGFD